MQQANQDMYGQQLKRERSMQLQGLEDARERLQVALDAGKLTQVPGSHKIMVTLFEELAERYREIQDTRVTGVAAKMRGWFRVVPADTLAVLSLNEVMNTFVKGDDVSVQLLLIRLGRRIHLEALVLQAAEVNPMYFQETEKYLQRHGTTNIAHYSATMRAAVRNVMHDLEYLLDSEYAQLGKLALDSIIELGVVERQVSYNGMHMYDLSSPVKNALQTVPEFASARNALCMLVPPKPWASLTEGGYLTSPWHPLIKRIGYRRADYQLVAKRIQQGDMFPIINSIQEQPLQILPRMHDLITELWQDGGGALGVPKVEYKKAPPYPLHEGWRDDAVSQEVLDERNEAHEAWLSYMRSWHLGRVRHVTHVLEMHQLVKGMDTPGTPLYFPVFTDSRGRMYYRGRLNPQGSDRAKSLIAFNEAKPLGNRGIYWLKVGLANAFGYDKVRFDKRAEWVDEHYELIRDGIKRPQDSDFFRANDEAPCMAVALAQELVAALESANPEGYMSRVPVHMDATASALQHLSAMLRDEEGGAMVNLFDTGASEKADLYTLVANNAIKYIESDTNENTKEYRDFWLEVGIPRDLAKRPVMTYAYGVTFQGVLRYVDDFLFEQQLKIDNKPVPLKYRTYCVNALLRAVEQAVPKAAAMMRWLQGTLRERQLESIQWTTKVGFPVVHYSEAVQRKRVNVRSCGINQIVLYDRTGRPDNQRMRNGVVPNLVHSNDACHWYMTAQRMRQLGCNIIGVHDSFGTHACDVDTLHKVIRETFVELYTEHDIIAEYIKTNNIESPPPEKGNLDINLFLESEFGFC